MVVDGPTTQLLAMGTTDPVMQLVDGVVNLVPVALPLVIVALITLDAVSMEKLKDQKRAANKGKNYGKAYTSSAELRAFVETNPPLGNKNYFKGLYTEITENGVGLPSAEKALGVINPTSVLMTGLTVFLLTPIFIVLFVPQSYWNPALWGK